jgi:crossover junction endodeoxyribonuclease RuvC
MNNKRIMAIDPGMGGGIAFIDTKTNLTWAAPIPVLGKQIDLADLAGQISYCKPHLIVLEKVHSMPGQGVASMFTFGKGYGSLLGIAAALRISCEEVTPQKWKGVVLSGTAKDKDAAIAYCRRVFPDIKLVQPGCRVAHTGVADALCLLEYARRKL